MQSFRFMGVMVGEKKNRNVIGGENIEFLFWSAITEKGDNVLLKYCCGSREEGREGLSLESLT